MSFEEYYKNYYIDTMKDCIKMAKHIDDDNWLAIASMIFGKVATPLKYLRDEYKEKDIRARSKMITQTKQADLLDKGLTVEGVKSSLADYLKNNIDDPEKVPEIIKALDFTVTDTDIIVNPKEYLGKDLFSKIARNVKFQGGEYISAGKDSHFRIPKKKES